jgi:hypothetical protein
MTLFQIINFFFHPDLDMHSDPKPCQDECECEMSGLLIDGLFP